MASTQQIYSAALKVWREREKHEDSVLLNGSHRGSYASWKPYIRWSANKKKYDSDFISSLYERCILDTQAFLPNLSKEEVSNPPSEEWEESRKKARSNLSKAKKHEESQIEKTSRDEMLSESENIWEDYILYMVSKKLKGSRGIHSILISPPLPVSLHRVLPMKPRFSPTSAHVQFAPDQTQEFYGLIIFEFFRN